MMRVRRLTSVAYIGPKSRTNWEALRKTKNWHRGSPRHTWLGHHIQGQKSQKVNWKGTGHFVAASRTTCYIGLYSACIQNSDSQ